MNSSALVHHHDDVGCSLLEPQVSSLRRTARQDGFSSTCCCHKAGKQPQAEQEASVSKKHVPLSEATCGESELYRAGRQVVA